MKIMKRSKHFAFVMNLLKYMNNKFKNYKCEIEANRGNVYRDTVLVSNLCPNLTLPLSFSLAALNPGVYQFNVRTLYNGDIVPSNDEKQKNLLKYMNKKFKNYKKEALYAA